MRRGSAAASRDFERPSDAIDVANVRLYEFTNTGLTLTTVDAAGKKTAATSWKKIS